jgi:hypothetical protein
VSWLSRRLVENGCWVLLKCLVGTSETVVITAPPQRAASLAACTAPCTGWRQVQRVTVSRGCLIMYLLRSEGHLSGCDTARRCLTAWTAVTNSRARSQLVGGQSYAVGHHDERNSSRAGICWPWLAGRRIPSSVSRRHCSTCCLPGRYLRGLATRSSDSCTTRPLRIPVPIRAPTKDGGRLAALQLHREARDGWAWRARGVSGPAIAHPQRQHSSTAKHR